MKAINRAQQEAREGTADLRRNTAQAASEGELARGERQTAFEDSLERAYDIFASGRYNESRAYAQRWASLGDEVQG